MSDPRLTRAALASKADAMFETLEDVLTDCRNRLIRAPRDRRSPMHTPVVVTGDVDARVMVLRAFDSAEWRLRFHTDARAPKAQVIAADPRAALLFYDKGSKVQIRVRGSAEIVAQGSEVDAAWTASTNFARRCYLGEAPGPRAMCLLRACRPSSRGPSPTTHSSCPHAKTSHCCGSRSRRSTGFILPIPAMSARNSCAARIRQYGRGAGSRPEASRSRVQAAAEPADGVGAGSSKISSISLASTT